MEPEAREEGQRARGAGMGVDLGEQVPARILGPAGVREAFRELLRRHGIRDEDGHPGILRREGDQAQAGILFGLGQSESIQFKNPLRT